MYDQDQLNINGNECTATTTYISFINLNNVPINRLYLLIKSRYLDNVID